MSGSPPQRTGTDIIHLNVGGKKFSTSRQTLTQVQSIISIFAHFFIFQSAGTRYILYWTTQWKDSDQQG